MDFYTKESIRGICLYTNKFIPAGEVIKVLDRDKVSKTITYQSIQVAYNDHFLEDAYFSKMNHSCDPTTIIDTKNYVCIAIRDIHPGEEINFFYPSTEWIMVRPFHCKCGSENCIEYVEGAYKMKIQHLQSYFINDHIKELIMELLKTTA